MNKRVMNLVNFVRGCEPRYPKDLYTPVVRQMEVNAKYGFDNTFLLQYDAMQREDFRALFLEKRDEKTELGVWFEMCRELTEKVGIPWRGRPGYDWDWYVDPGFLMAYEPKEREMLIDEVFRRFREIFGEYPAVVGSWLLDAYSMNYMCEHYSIKAFCVCREQHAVDAYTLWGGYYNGGYYAAKSNMLCPAQRDGNAIEAPIFRMLGIDPIYSYEKHSGSTGCCTLEPTWESGHTASTVDWYLRTYYENPCLSHSEVTTGQENSFGWECFGEGYMMQAEKIAALRDKGVLTVEKLGDTGEAFKKEFSCSEPAAICATEDWHGEGHKSVWYNCINYRTNLFVEEGRLFFRDVQMFDDRFAEKYLTRPAGTWDATYENLPIVDGYLWKGKDRRCALDFPEGVAMGKITEDGKDLVVALDGTAGGAVRFSEKRIEITGVEALIFSMGSPKAKIELCGDRLTYTYRDFTYHLDIAGGIAASDAGFVLTPENGKILLIFVKA